MIDCDQFNMPGVKSKNHLENSFRESQFELLIKLMCSCFCCFRNRDFYQHKKGKSINIAIE